MAQFRHVLATSDSDMDGAERDIAARTARLDSMGSRYAPLITSPDEQQRFERFTSAWATYMRTWEQVQADSRSNRQAEARDRLGGEGRRQYETAAAALSDIVLLNANGALAAGRDASTSYERSRVIFAVVLVSALGVGLGLAFGIARMIARPVATLAESAEAIARGELGVHVSAQTRDELGTLQGAFGRMLEAQREMTRSAVAIAAGDMSATVKARGERDELGHAFVALRGTLNDMLTESSMLVAAARDGRLSTRGNAGQFKGAYRDLVQGINDTLEAVVAPINDASVVLAALADRDLTARVTSQYAGDHSRMRDAINVTAIATAGNATEARIMTETARQAVGAGASAMQQLSEAMDRIKASSDQTARIVKTIDEIAFQTNLLALNAAVEAARAGDAGRGFAVVADEVRTLAIRCAEAARNTTALIEEGVQVTASGVSLNADVTARLIEIDREVTRVSSVVADIASAGVAQRDGVQQITQAVNELNDVTQQVAANAEESASASEELAGQSQSLKSLVSQFCIAGADDARRLSASGLSAAPRTRASAGARTQRTARPAPKTAGTSFTGRPVAATAAPASDPMDTWPALDEENDRALMQF